MTEKESPDDSDMTSPQKVLLVMDVVYKFKNKVDRIGADTNYDKIVNIFSNNFDCEILHGKKPRERKCQVFLKLCPFLVLKWPFTCP